MSGVVDEYGQWEHCNCCGELVRLSTMVFEPRSVRRPYGRDLCRECAR